MTSLETELVPFTFGGEDLHFADVDYRWLLIWDRIDVRNIGRVFLKEMEYFLLHMDYGDRLPSEAIASILNKADENRDGFITKKEFITMLQKNRKSPFFRRLIRESMLITIPRSARTAKVRRYADEFRCLPPPIFILLITIAEIGVFIYNSCAYGEPITINGPLFLDSKLIYNPYKRYEAWRFLSYILIHAGWLHLVNNLILQLILGVILELVHGWWRIMIVYFLGAIGGCLAASVTNPNYYLAGSSGGVYAIIYAYIGNLILNWSEMSFPLLQAITIGFISTLDVGYAVWDTYFSDKPSSTSYMAHLGGALCGVLVGVNVLRNLKKEPWEKYCWWICFVLFSALFAAAILFHIFATDYFPTPDR